MFFKKKKPKKLHPEVIADLVQNTDFTAEEIIKSYKSSIELFPNGRLTLQQFTDKYSYFFPFGNSDELAEYVFDTYDINKDGYIDFHEYMYAVSFVKHGNYRKKLRWVFQLFDHNKDGYISLKEMWFTVKAIFLAMRGLIEHECMGSLCRIVKNIFTKMDTNRDWKISRREFLIGVDAEPLFLEILDSLTIYASEDASIYYPDYVWERIIRLVKPEHAVFKEPKKPKSKRKKLNRKQLSTIDERNDEVVDETNNCELV